jgi:tetratricopeptide (TPR) repeat protein
MAGTYTNLGKYERSIELAKRAMEINPNFPFCYPNLVWSLIFRERLNEAQQALRTAAEHKIVVPDLLLLPYVIAFLKGDRAAMEQAAAAAKQSADAADWMTYTEATVLAHSGRWQLARAGIRQAMNLSLQMHQPERAAMFQAGAAVRAALFGLTVEARQNAGAALELSTSRDVEYGAAFALAVSGDDAASQVLARDLEKRFPEDTCVKFTYLPVHRALMSLHGGDPAGAIEHLRVAEPYDLALPCSAFAFFGDLNAPYVRGQAYLAARRYAEAAREFQKVLDHPGIVITDPVSALAHLQMARALAAAGDSAKAKAAYQAYRSLWRDADGDLPVFRQAGAEFPGF